MVEEVSVSESRESSVRRLSCLATELNNDIPITIFKGKVVVLDMFGRPFPRQLESYEGSMRITLSKDAIAIAPEDSSRVLGYTLERDCDWALEKDIHERNMPFVFATLDSRGREKSSKQIRFY